MNEVNSPTLGSAGKNLSEKKSSPGINSFSPPTAEPKLSFKKPSCDAEGKDCVSISKIPRPPMTASYSFNETLKSSQSNAKTKKAPSMIPRSKSRKRNQNGKIRIDIPSKAESPKKYFNKTSDSGNKEGNEISTDYEIELPMPPDDHSRKPISGEHESKLAKEEFEISSLNLKPCLDVIKDKGEESDVPNTEAQDVFSSSQIARKEEEIKAPPAEEVKEKEEYFPEEERETRIIRHLYETIKCSVGPLFENAKWMDPEKFRSKGSEISCTYSTKSGGESISEASPIQEHYDVTLNEILNIWRSTSSLLGSVKNHTEKFMEEDDKLIDKEQLVLEAEMLQAALDFAVSYSKLKTEFLVTFVKKHLNISDSGTNKLENLMDSKLFATLYNVEDLATMAQNVHDLSASLRNGEDFELD